jgi:hypothetical protein
MASSVSLGFVRALDGSESGQDRCEVDLFLRGADLLDAIEHVFRERFELVASNELFVHSVKPRLPLAPQFLHELDDTALLSLRQIVHE